MEGEGGPGFEGDFGGGYGAAFGGGFEVAGDPGVAVGDLGTSPAGASPTGEFAIGDFGTVSGDAATGALTASPEIEINLGDLGGFDEGGSPSGFTSVGGGTGTATAPSQAQLALQAQMDADQAAIQADQAIQAANTHGTGIAVGSPAGPTGNFGSVPGSTTGLSIVSIAQGILSGDPVGFPAVNSALASGYDFEMQTNVPNAPSAFAEATTGKGDFGLTPGAYNPGEYNTASGQSSNVAGKGDNAPSLNMTDAQIAQFNSDVPLGDPMGEPVSVAIGPGLAVPAGSVVAGGALPAASVAAPAAAPAAPVVATAPAPEPPAAAFAAPEGGRVSIGTAAQDGPGFSQEFGAHNPNFGGGLSPGQTSASVNGFGGFSSDAAFDIGEAVRDNPDNAVLQFIFGSGLRPAPRA